MAKKTTAWDKLLMKEKAQYIRLGIQNGIYDIRAIKDVYNEYHDEDSKENYDYNMAAAIATGFGPNQNKHWPDTFKKSNHPTFSVESIYSTKETPGGTWGPNFKTFEPSDWMINTYGSTPTIEYLQKHDPGVTPVYKGGVLLPEITVTANRLTNGGHLGHWKDGTQEGEGQKLNPLSTIRKKFYRHIYPSGYAEAIPRIVGALKGEDDVLHTNILNDGSSQAEIWDPIHMENKQYLQTGAFADEQMKYRDDIFATYLGIPQSERRDFPGRISLIPSKYKPTKNSRGINTPYYTFPKENIPWDNIIKETQGVGTLYLLDNNVTNDMDIWYPLVTNQNTTVGSGSLYDALGEYTVGLGYDPNKGQYVSLYDLWDINPFGKGDSETLRAKNANKKDKSFGIGIPTQIYDRMYLDDYYGLTGNERGSYYLPEVTVTAGAYDPVQVGGVSVSDLGTNQKSTGGPLYPFSFEKNPFIKTPVVRYDEGGQKQDASNPGGYTDEQLNKNYSIWKTYDPTGGLNIWNYAASQNAGNLARGEENEYWKEYLGLDSAVPLMNPNAYTEWDKQIEAQKTQNGQLTSDFYGTTPRMDYNIQALADTLMLGKMVRNYAEYDKTYDIPHIETITKAYEQAKNILNNPNKWTLVDGEIPIGGYRFDSKTSETNPLGMLSHFGMKWVPEENALYMHDTYDFPQRVHKRTDIPIRPREMKIRSKINFDPTMGSWLLRSPVNYNTQIPVTVTK